MPLQAEFHRGLSTFRVPMAVNRTLAPFARGLRCRARAHLHARVWLTTNTSQLHAENRRRLVDRLRNVARVNSGWVLLKVQ